jgi:hypothetical protein
MKPIRQQLKEALGTRDWAWYCDFSLTVIAGFAILFGAIYGMKADSVRDTFDVKVAIGCIAVAGVCVLLASKKVFVLSCALMVPGALVLYHALFSGDRTAWWVYFVSTAVGYFVLILGTLATSLWQNRSSRRRK